MDIKSIDAALMAQTAAGRDLPLAELGKYDLVLPSSVMREFGRSLEPAKKKRATRS